jgi:mannosyltransferase
VLAVAAAAGLVSVIGRRLASSRAGLTAGLLLAAFPITTRYGQEARSYALVMALATLASYLLIRSFDPADGLSPRWRRLAPYALTVTAMSWLNLMSLLLVPAHALTLALTCRRALTGRDPPASSAATRRFAAGWLAAAAAAGLAVSPLVVLAWPQRHGTAQFLAPVGLTEVIDAPWHLTGSWLALIAAAPLAVVAVLPAVHPRPALARLCLPWLLLPPAVLLTAGAFVPAYDPRYILFCIPAFALLAGSGLDAVATLAQARWPQARLRGWIIPAGLLIIALLGLPEQFGFRAPDGHIENIRQAAQIVAATERPGDAVLYAAPWWRQFSAAYPQGFDHLRDIALARTPTEADNLTGQQFPVSMVRAKLASVPRVWLIERKTFRPVPALTGGHWRIVASWHITSIVMVLYQHVPLGQAIAEPAFGRAGGRRSERLPQRLQPW